GNKKAADLPQPPTASTPEDVLNSDMLPPSMPKVTAAATGDNATFTWAVEKPGDTYTVQTDGGSQTVSAGSFSATFGAASQVCVKVIAHRGSTVSQGMGQACASR